jgi:hypothetical protein
VFDQTQAKFARAILYQVLMAENLFMSSFPLYTIANLGKNEFYIAGGGGQAKTGVPNAIVSSG